MREADENTTADELQDILGFTWPLTGLFCLFVLAFLFSYFFSFISHNHHYFFLATVEVAQTAEPAPQAQPTPKVAVLANGRTVKVAYHVKTGEHVVIKLPSEEYDSKI